MQENVVKTTRIEYIDFVRGLGIILMVEAHIPLEDHFVHYVHAFHMPLFFFISGWLYKDGSLTLNGFKSKSKKFLLPYFTSALLGYMLWLVEMKPNNSLELVRPLISVVWINTEGMPIAGALWFLTALLFVDSMYHICQDHFGYGIKLHMVISFFVIFGLVETMVLPVRLPWAIGSGCVGIGFYHLGNCLHRSRNKCLLYLGRLKICVLFLISSIFAMKNGKINMRTGQYANIILFWFTSVVFILILWNIALYIYAKGVRARVIEEIGKYSIIWVCLNEIVINIVKSVLYKFGIPGMSLVIISAVLVIIILFITQRIILSTPLKRLFSLK